MKNLFLVSCACAVILSGCATKRYPVATPLSPAQAELMTCRELALEMTEVDQVQKQIIDTAETDWRSVAGFLGDYGIGNAMAKSEAEKALIDRKASIQAAMTKKQCPGFVIPPDDASTQPQS